MRAIRIIFTFYKNFFFLSFILSLCCAIALHVNGIGIFALVFWFKVFTLGLIFYFIKQYKKKEFYYYQNLGVSKLFLWTTTLFFDMVLFIILLALTYKSR